MNGLIAVVGGVVGVFIIGVIINIIKEQGRLEQQASDDTAKVITAKKQGAIMAESRNSEDAADRLDNGSF